MLRRIFALALLAVPAFSADWIEYRSGPFHIFSNAGDRKGREALNQLEQLRYVLDAQIGKSDLTTIWPINLVLFANQKEYAPHVLPKPLTEGGSALLAAWTGESALPPDLLRAITTQLIEDNSARMPAEIETALEDLFSTIQASGTRVNLGTPVPGLPPERLRPWAKMQMLATLPDFSGKLHVYLNNVQQSGDEDAAARNAFDLTATQLNSRVDAYVRSGKFEAAPMNARALSPNRDFIEKNVERPVIDTLVRELDAGGRTFPPESPRGLLAKNTMASLELAAKANPRWAEPHFKMAMLETNPAAKIAHLKTAASLGPRNSSYWQTLATTQASAGLFADAEKSWIAAERAAPAPADRDRIHQAKLDFQDQRAQAELAERKRVLEEEARDLERVKEAAAAEVRAAERAANARLAANGSNIQNPVPAFGSGPGTKLSGSLTRVECIGKSFRLTIQPETGPPLKLLIRDPKQLIVAVDSGDADFPCGPQRPPRNIELQYESKSDPKLGTAGDVTAVKFP